MNHQDNNPLHAAINAKLAGIVAGMATRPAWYETWQSLGPDSSEEQRLFAYQAVRDAAVLPPDAGFYIVSWQIDAMASLIAEEALRGMDDELSAIEDAHGLGKDEFWMPGEAPEEYEQLHRRYMQAWDRLFAEQLQRHGEHQLAQLFETDPEGFQQRSDRGREYFYGLPDDPEHWLNELGEAVAATMIADSAVGPLGFWHSEQDGCWTVVIYPRPVELVGGAEDGEVLAPGFSLDLEELRQLFERVNACSWQALGLNDDEGPHVSIEGIYQGHEVFLQVLAYTPDDEEPGLRLETDSINVGRQLIAIGSLAAAKTAGFPCAVTTECPSRPQPRFAEVHLPHKAGR